MEALQTVTSGTGALLSWRPTCGQSILLLQHDVPPDTAGDAPSEMLVVCKLPSPCAGTAAMGAIAYVTVASVAAMGASMSPVVGGSGAAAPRCWRRRRRRTPPPQLHRSRRASAPASR